MQQKLLVKHSLGLALETVFLGFISGMPYKPELLQKTLETYTLRRDIDYPTEMRSVRNMLSSMIHGVWRNEVYTVLTNGHVVTSTELMLMIRCINISHHGARTIIINDDVVFVPESLQSFPDEEVLAYLQVRLAKIGYYKLGEGLIKNPQMINHDHPGELKLDRPPVFPFNHPKGQKKEIVSKPQLTLLLNRKTA